jgi:hypothetical protein
MTRDRDLRAPACRRAGQAGARATTSRTCADISKRRLRQPTPSPTLSACEYASCLSPPRGSWLLVAAGFSRPLWACSGDPDRSGRVVPIVDKAIATARTPPLQQAGSAVRQATDCGFLVNEPRTCLPAPACRRAGQAGKSGPRYPLPRTAGQGHTKAGASSRTPQKSRTVRKCPVRYNRVTAVGTPPLQNEASDGP